MMRSLILGVAALLAVAIPGLAAAETGGSIKLTYASLDGDRAFDGESFGNSSDNVVALSGVVITDLAMPNWRIQFNGVSSDTDSEFFSDAHSQVEVHATYDAGQFQVGVFTGMFNNNGHSFYEYGAEAAMNFDRGQIAVSAVAATSPNSSFFDDTTSIVASGTFNLNDSWSVGATVSSTDFGNFYGANSDVDAYGVNVAYQIPNSDFTIAVGYRSADSGQDTDFIGVSLAWGFGEGARGREMLGGAALIPDAIAGLNNFAT